MRSSDIPHASARWNIVGEDTHIHEFTPANVRVTHSHVLPYLWAVLYMYMYMTEVHVQGVRINTIGSDKQNYYIYIVHTDLEMHG